MTQRLWWARKKEGKASLATAKQKGGKAAVEKELPGGETQLNQERRHLPGRRNPNTRRGDSAGLDRDR